MRPSINQICIVIILVLLILNIGSLTASSCKDIVAVNNATNGPYNLFLKVRDPSRPGLQVLTIVPQGTTYTYPHPRTGKPLTFTVTQSYIGVASKGDTLPAIVKAGMSLSQSAIAYGDADTNSNWINLRKHAWDDFDWIRYACEQASTEEEAVHLLTKECVDQLHATAVSENLFIVGPHKAYLIEADAYRYHIQEIHDIAVMSNYPDALWSTQLYKKKPIASAFDTVKQQPARTGQTIRLGSLFGIRISKVGNDYIIARQIPRIKLQYGRIQHVGKPIQISTGQRKTVGDYSVTLHRIQRKKAYITVEYYFHAWEQKMKEKIMNRYGKITLQDMFSWSRLHKEDLENLRGMCQPGYPHEAVMAYKIPHQHYLTLTSGWFAPNHACTSIYVPIHINASDIHPAYTTGDAAQLSLSLSETWDHKTLALWCTACENVFLTENTRTEQKIIEKKSIANASYLLTQIDLAMQHQAYLTQEIWHQISQEPDTRKNQLQPLIAHLWNNTYTHSMASMFTLSSELQKIPQTTWYQKKINTLQKSIITTRWHLITQLYPNKGNAAPHSDIISTANQSNINNYESSIMTFFHWSDALLSNEVYIQDTKEKQETDMFALTTFNYLLIIILMAVILIIIRFKIRIE